MVAFSGCWRRKVDDYHLQKGVTSGQEFTHDNFKKGPSIKIALLSSKLNVRRKLLGDTQFPHLFRSIYRTSAPLRSASSSLYACALFRSLPSFRFLLFLFFHFFIVILFIVRFLIVLLFHCSFSPLFFLSLSFHNSSLFSILFIV